MVWNSSVWSVTPRTFVAWGLASKASFVPVIRESAPTLTTSHQMGQLPVAAIDVATVCVDARGNRLHCACDRSTGGPTV